MWIEEKGDKYTILRRKDGKGQYRILNSRAALVKKRLEELKTREERVKYGTTTTPD